MSQDSSTSQLRISLENFPSFWHRGHLRNMARRWGGKGCALWHTPWGLLFVKAAPRLPLIVLWAELAPSQLLGCENYKYGTGTFLSSTFQLQKGPFGRGAQVSLLAYSCS